MTVDWTISIGNILTIATMIGAVVLFLLRNARDSGVKEVHAGTLRDDVILIKADLKELNKVVTTLAVQNTRLNNQAERMGAYDKRFEGVEERIMLMQRDYNLLRSGRGFIAADVDGEYEHERKLAAT